MTRALAAHPEGMRPIDAWIQDPASSSGHGWLDPADDTFSLRLDKREDFAGAPIDLGWIGEDVEGIWCSRDPYCAALEEPEVWAVLLSVWGGQLEVTRHDYETLAARDYVLRLHAVAAVHRWEREQIRNGRS